MSKVAELRAMLRGIKKQLSKGLGIEDFKYLNTKKKPQLLELLAKYEKQNKGALTIQQAVRNKRAKKEALQEMSRRDKQQLKRDLELKLSLIQEPEKKTSIADVSLSARNKRERLSKLYQPPVIPNTTSAKKKREAITKIYEAPLTPLTTFELFNAPATVPTPPPIKRTTPVFRKRALEEFKYLPTPVKFNMRPITAVPKKELLRVQDRPRPATAGRTYNKYKPLV